MNYVVEDGFDFFKELNEPTTIDSSITCMISHLPLTHNSITMHCNHSFNYLPLYKELSLHNNKQYISCPYCRTISSKLIPYIPIPGIIKLTGVNHPESECMPGPRCSVLLKMGARKGIACGHRGMVNDDGIYCGKHLKNAVIWTTAMEDLFKAKGVGELKQMLKDKGMKVGGIKRELVKRLLA